MRETYGGVVVICYGHCSYAPFPFELDYKKRFGLVETAWAEELAPPTPRNIMFSGVAGESAV